MVEGNHLRSQTLAALLRSLKHPPDSAELMAGFTKGQRTQNLSNCLLNSLFVKPSGAQSL